MNRFAAAVALLACSCQGLLSSNPPQAGSALPTNLVLRTYDVPGDAAPQVRRVLKDLMWFGADGKDSQKYVGRAEVGVDGRLVVLANEGVQEGVKSLIGQISSHPPKPAPVIQVEYWFVLGKPGAGEKPPPALQEVKAALAEIEKTDGPQEFTLSEKFTAQAISGEVARVNGRESEVNQTATATGEGIRADVHLERMGQKLDTRMNFAPGQLVVLGSSGADSKDKTEAPRAIYYIVRAALHDGSGR